MNKADHALLRREYDKMTERLILSDQPSAHILGKFYATDTLFNFVETFEDLLEKAETTDEILHIMEASVRLSYDIIRIVVERISNGSNDAEGMALLLEALAELANAQARH